MGVVWIYTLSAFGGPQVHLALMDRFFVQREKMLSSGELMDLYLFCQILPGPASTQMLALLAYKKGGPFLSFLALLIWILPATILMLLLAVFISFFKTEGHFLLPVFQFVALMALGFFLHYSLKIALKMPRRKTSFFIAGISAAGTFLFFHSPWVFPLMFVFGALMSYGVQRKGRLRTPQAEKIKKNWRHLLFFIFFFVLAGALSEAARIGQWEHRKIFNVFENNYRFGTLVFGGGQMLAPMMYEKYAVSKKTKYVAKEDVLTGFGLLPIVPGPVFSISAYVGALIFASQGLYAQIGGGILATLAIFLPGYWLCIFFYPMWQKVKGNHHIFRTMMGLNAVVAGILLGSLGFLFRDVWLWISASSTLYIYVACFIFSGSFLALQYTKIAPPYIVLGVLLTGALLGGG